MKNTTSSWNQPNLFIPSPAQAALPSSSSLFSSNAKNLSERVAEKVLEVYTREIGAINQKSKHGNRKLNVKQNQHQQQQQHHPSAIELVERLDRRSNGDWEWTVLAGICICTPLSSIHFQNSGDTEVEESDRWRVECISFGTGVKCLPHAKLPINGDQLHDSHAEVLAKRAFQKWLFEQIRLACIQQDQGQSIQSVSNEGKGKSLENVEMDSFLKPMFDEGGRMKGFRWKDQRVRIGMYVSTLPCGDASTYALSLIAPPTPCSSTVNDEACDAIDSVQGITTNKKKQLFSIIQAQDLGLQTSRSDAIRNHESELETEVYNPPSSTSELAMSRVIRGRIAYDQHSILRTKPGRLDSSPTSCMSCSDKILSWTLMGVQGALLSRLLMPFLSSSLSSSSSSSIGTMEIQKKEEKMRTLPQEEVGKHSASGELPPSRCQDQFKSPEREKNRQDHVQGYGEDESMDGNLLHRVMIDLIVLGGIAEYTNPLLESRIDRTGKAFAGSKHVEEEIKKHVEKSLVGRLQGLTVPLVVNSIESPTVQVQAPLIFLTKQKFQHGKEEVQSEVFRLRETGLNYVMGNGVERINNGIRQGASTRRSEPKAPLSLKVRSRLCKLNLFEDYLHIRSFLEPSSPSSSVETLSNLTYYETKHGVKSDTNDEGTWWYSHLKKLSREAQGAFQGWLVGGLHYESFDSRGFVGDLNTHTTT